MTLNAIKLTEDKFPILFENKSSNKCSGRYGHIDTIKPVEVIRSMGWEPREVVVMRTIKEERKGFQKHRVRFFNPRLNEINGNHPELLLTNSHDGTTSFKIQLGIYRIVCSNGLLVGDTIKSASVKHIGYTDERIENAITYLNGNCDSLLNSVENFGSKQFEDMESKINYAKEAIKFRLSSDVWNISDESALVELLTPIRIEDTKEDLWTTMNVIQERVIKKGFACKKIEGIENKPYKVKPTVGFKAQDEFNRNLWDLTDQQYAIM